MEITDAQVIRFSNERVRTIADSLYSTYFRCKSIIDDYNAADIGTKINDGGAGNLVADGSDIDGRTRITGGDIYNLVTAIQQFINYVEGQAVDTTDRTTTITKPHVNQF